MHENSKYKILEGKNSTKSTLVKKSRLIDWWIHWRDWFIKIESTRKCPKMEKTNGQTYLFSKWRGLNSDRNEDNKNPKELSNTHPRINFPNVKSSEWIKMSNIFTMYKMYNVTSPDGCAIATVKGPSKRFLTIYT